MTNDDTPNNAPEQPENPAEAQADRPGEPMTDEARLDLLPKPTFSTFILSLASSALVQLGEVPDPTTGGTNPNISMAKHTIDLLSMLQEKVEKGIDADEKRLLEGLLYELRMKYVLKTK